MRIVHFSDWHGRQHRLPEADLYVCTGDMYRNYSWLSGEESKLKERTEQQAEAKKAVFLKNLGSPEAPVVCVRGNHDFAALGPLFEGDCNLVHEFLDNEVIDVCGFKIAGHRGIPFINGCWSDEERRADLVERVKKMPLADVYLTHYAPSGSDLDGRDLAHYGLEEMLNFMVYRTPWHQNSPRQLHCFGHIHECGGRSRTFGDILLSNAATRINVIEGDPQKGWVHVLPEGK